MMLTSVGTLPWGWCCCSCGGFGSGPMKKAGHAVESFKSEKGDRTYRINQ